MPNPRFFQLVALGLAVLMLLALIPVGWPREFYSFLRYGVCFGSLLLMAIPTSLLSNKTYWLGALLAFALLFNPIQKTKFKRQTWQTFNLLGLGVFGILAVKIKNLNDV